MRRFFRVVPDMIGILKISKLLLNQEDAVTGIGVKICDLGTHSCRDGVATMVAVGCTVSPPIVSICVRACWVIGGVKDKYLQRESAGDQHVGRCASYLPILSMDFVVSPPYFYFSGIEDDISKVSAKSRI